MLNKKTLLFFVLCFFISLNNVSTDLKLGQKNVCSRNLTEHETMFEIMQRHYRMKHIKNYYYSTIGGLVFKCCDGYDEIDDHCEPLCINCIHGRCSAPKQCDCLPNFGGLHCEKTCSPGTFGLDCEFDCQCLNDPKCNKNYTHCNCENPRDKMSVECDLQCNCRLHECKRGFIGNNCSVPCPDHTFGEMCLESCNCNQNNTLNCNKETGYCHCKPTYYGIECEQRCVGILECLNNATISCTCRPTVEQRIERVVDETKKTKEHFEKKINHLNNFIWLSIGIAVILFGFMIYKLKVKTKRLKRHLNEINIRYSTNKSNMIYNLTDANLQASFSSNSTAIIDSDNRTNLNGINLDEKKSTTNATIKDNLMAYGQMIKKSDLIKKFNSMSDNLKTKLNTNNQSKGASGLSKNSEPFYSTISETISVIDDKDEKIEMPK